MVGNRIFVTADMHLGHTGLSDDGYRPKDFGELIVKRMGLLLNPSDLLIDLGDVCWGDYDYWFGRLKDIQCTKWLVRGNHDKKCISKETRILTKYGYKCWNEIREGDLIPTANLETGKVEFNPILDVCVYKKEPYLYEARHRSGEMAVTDHHTVIYQSGLEKRTKTWKKNIAENLWTIKNEFVIPCHFSSSGSLNCDPRMLKLLAWIMTDGSIDRGAIRIYQSKIKYVEEIRSLLSSLNIGYSEGLRHKKVKSICGKAVKSTLPQYVFRVSAGESHTILRTLKLKAKYYVPEWLFDLSDFDFDIFLNELVKGDGSFRENGHRVLWGKKDWLYDILGLCVTHGIHANVMKQSGYNNFYLGIRGSHGHKQFAPRHLKKIFYNDLVWCVNVKNHNFFAELNGKTFVTGNSISWYMDRGYNMVCDGFRLDMFGTRIMFSHWPVPESNWDINIHGHFHAFGLERVKEVEPQLFEVLTPKHRLISLEALHYEPIKLQRIVEGE
jgi:calcineurin-like phosphoesterase family protein